MSDPDPLSDARMWAQHAREDVRTGRLLLADPVGVRRQSAWFAQQAAEKTLKALLIAYQRPFPYTHDLERLLDLLPDEERSRYGDFEIEPLSTYGVDTRYPGVPTTDPEEANAAIEVAEQIVDAVLQDPNM